MPFWCGQGWQVQICRVGWYRLEIQVWFGVSALSPKSTEQAFVCWRSLFCLWLLFPCYWLLPQICDIWGRKETNKNQVSLPGPEGPSQSASSVCFICNVQGFQSYLGGGIRKSMYTLSSQKCSRFFNLAELISLMASEFSDIFNKAFFMPKSLRIHSWFLLELTIFFTFKIIHLASHLWD